MHPPPLQGTSSRWLILFPGQLLHVSTFVNDFLNDVRQQIHNGLLVVV